MYAHSEIITGEIAEVEKINPPCVNLTAHVTGAPNAAQTEPDGAIVALSLHANSQGFRCERARNVIEQPIC